MRTPPPQGSYHMKSVSYEYTKQGELKPHAAFASRSPRTASPPPPTVGPGAYAAHAAHALRVKMPDRPTPVMASTSPRFAAQTPQHTAVVQWELDHDKKRFWAAHGYPVIFAKARSCLLLQQQLHIAAVAEHIAQLISGRCCSCLDNV